MTDSKTTRMAGGALIGATLALFAACTAIAPGGAPLGPTAAEAGTFLDTVNSTMLKLGIASAQAGWVAQNFITDDTEALDARATQAAADATAKFAKDSTPLRSPRASRRPASATRPAQGRARAGDAGRSEGRRGGDAAGLAHARDLRQGQVVSGSGQAGSVPQHRRSHARDGELEKREGAAPRVGGLAHDVAADEDGLRPVRRALEQGRQRAGLRRYGRDVAGEVRHAARCVCQGAGSAVGPGASALSRAARVRAHEAAGEVRRRRSGEGTDSRAPARQHLGAGLVEHLSAGRRRRSPTPATRSPTS